MPERSNVEVTGFTHEDRKVLITVQVKMERLETDVRDGLSRITRLEADRVGRKDIEDLLGVIDEKSQENTTLIRRAAQLETRVDNLERQQPEFASIRRLVYIGLGVLAAVEVLLGFFKK